MFPASPTRTPLTVEQADRAWPRTACRWSRSSGVGGTGQWRPVRAGAEPLQPPDHRATPSSSSPARPPARRCCAPRPTRPAGRARHAQQLRRRRHAVGHRPVRRGELQPVLRRAGDGVPAELTADSYARYGIDRRPRPSGARKWERVDQRFDLTQEPQRGVPVRLDRRDRPVRPEARRRASTPRSAGSSTRAPTSRSPPTAGSPPTWATTSAVDYIYKFVSAEDVAQGTPRRPRAQHDAARRRHAVRREVHRRRRTTDAPSTTAPASGSR